MHIIKNARNHLTSIFLFLEKLIYAVHHLLQYGVEY